MGSGNSKQQQTDARALDGRMTTGLHLNSNSNNDRSDEVNVKNEKRNDIGATTSFSSDTTSETTTSACPMKRTDGSYSFDWGALFRRDFPHGPSGRKPISEQEARSITAAPETLSSDGSPSSAGCPVQQTNSRASSATTATTTSSRTNSSSSGCPVKHKEYNVYSQPIDGSNNMPKEANQLPAPGQSKPLSTDRVSSSIPKGGAQPGTTWTYPSPQMFYNALARKGKLSDTDEEEIESVVALHNNMNEKTWKKVLDWEATIAGDDDADSEPPKLLKFTGRPTDLSPKAWFKHNILGHPLPYDRHDWTVLRRDGTTLRYVIDYYYDESRASEHASSAMPDLNNASATPSLLVDVRPALDGLAPLWYRSVLMPVARHVTGSTRFEPLALKPTAQMKSQVFESVSVWQNIQSVASGQKRSDDDNESNQEALIRSEREAKQLAEAFATTLKSCRQTRLALDQCESNEDCARASLDWTICMAESVCPLQQQALATALQGDNDGKIEAALERVNECVALKTLQHAQAKKDYPSLFRS